MAVILLRHTRPVGAEGLCYGRTELPPGPDVAAEAARIAAALPPLARIVTSPLARARALAEALGPPLGLSPEPDPRLAEMDFGSWEGLRWDDVPRAELDAWAADLLGARPHGGESVAMLAARMAEALAALEAGPAPVLVVTHAGPIRAALARAGRPGAWEARIPFGGLVPLAPPAAPGAP